MKWTIYRSTVRDPLAGLRLDQYLAEAHAGMSRSLAKKIVDLGGVHVNGRRVRSCSMLVQPDDKVEVYIDHLPLEPFRLSPEVILYQDQYLIILNKPAMIETQPTHARYKGTLFEALNWYLRDPGYPHRKVEVGMIQRLDRGTSGVLAFSIHPRAHKQMSHIFKSHEVTKSYLAVVHDAPQASEGEIKSNLARSRRENRVKSVVAGGKEAITRFRVVEKLAACTLLKIDLITGRSHQIRAHMSELGCPLLGDRLYGGSDRIANLPIQRPLLHSSELGFAHPVKGNALMFSAPLPPDMATVICRLKETEQ